MIGRREHLLERDDGSCWQTSVALEPGRSYRYRYLINGGQWENAWTADGYVPNPYGRMIRWSCRIGSTSVTRAINSALEVSFRTVLPLPQSDEDLRLAEPSFATTVVNGHFATNPAGVLAASEKIRWVGSPPTGSSVCRP